MIGSVNRATLFVTGLAAACALALPAIAAPPASSTAREAGSGMATGKVALQDLHFTTRAAAAATCDKAPVTTAADGSFMCSVPADSAAAKTGRAGYDLKEAKKP